MEVLSHSPLNCRGVPQLLGLGLLPLTAAAAGVFNTGTMRLGGVQQRAAPVRAGQARGPSFTRQVTTNLLHGFWPDGPGRRRHNYPGRTTTWTRCTNGPGTPIWPASTNLWAAGGFSDDRP